ncbi:hypothetical protein JKP88DRAFT_36281 [Tribonema minus]|uniref:Pyridoxamine 5'-phosphate oxidase N-terminal domain-containing protein n=1 Tax=Tribonema minus TaxID=303371 RepID=A0A835ZAR3_9STRA|nr:hypothetical protein JKP88DRAFT_36281 [Tribonema minus]
MGRRDRSLVSTLAIIGALAYVVTGVMRKRRKRAELGYYDGTIEPPLPPEVVALLHKCSLCYLSTFTDDHPHLSLMNFTYYQPDEVIIMSTRRDTKKYNLLQSSNNVAVLVHDFPGQRSRDGSSSSPPLHLSSDETGKMETFSITMNGRARIEAGEVAETYREEHRKNNPGSEQFIVGDNIAIVSVKIETARICNLADKVTYWDVRNQTSNSNQQQQQQQQETWSV